METSGQFHVPVSLPLVKYPSVSIEYEAGWAPEQVWTLYRKEKLLAHVRNRTPAVLPVAVPTEITRHL
jgi:hypothetical protein